ncbi:MAG: hypothetical protein R6X08_10320 [Desulfosalsimonadaceae bacterium]
MRSPAAYKNIFCIPVLLLLFCVAGFLSACATDTETEPVSLKAKNPGVALVPFLKGRNPTSHIPALSCPYDEFCYEDSHLDPGADQIMTGLLQEKLLNRLEQRAFPLSLTKQIYSPLQFDHPDATPMEIACRTGRELGVDYVLVGNVWRYEKRAGSAYSVSEPASVAFALYLVDPASEKTVWVAEFNETQQSLSENLLKARLFFKRGAKWITARELARYGIEQLLAKFPVQ